MKYLYDPEERINELIKLDGTEKEDNSRLALFYIISNIDELYHKVNYLYDFQKHEIKLDVFENQDVDFSGSSYNLILLGYNLYNAFNKADVNKIFSLLDNKRMNIAFRAIKIKFRGFNRRDYLWKDYLYH